MTIGSFSLIFWSLFSWQNSSLSLWSLDFLRSVKFFPSTFSPNSTFSFPWFNQWFFSKTPWSTKWFYIFGSQTEPKAGIFLALTHFLPFCLFSIPKLWSSWKLSKIFRFEDQRNCQIHFPLRSESETFILSQTIWLQWTKVPLFPLSFCILFVSLSPKTLAHLFCLFWDCSEKSNSL